MPGRKVVWALEPCYTLIAWLDTTELAKSIVPKSAVDNGSLYESYNLPIWWLLRQEPITGYANVTLINNIKSLIQDHFRVHFWLTYSIIWNSNSTLVSGQMARWRTANCSPTPAYSCYCACCFKVNIGITLYHSLHSWLVYCKSPANFPQRDNLTDDQILEDICHFSKNFNRPL